jgi:hypothetical protein
MVITGEFHLLGTGSKRLIPCPEDPLLNRLHKIAPAIINSTQSPKQ